MPNQQKLLEAGDIEFYIRHKVLSPGDSSQISSPNDIQRLYILLKPTKKNFYRLIVIGKKKLPPTFNHQCYWGVVELVTNDYSTIQRELQEYSYWTRTRGNRIRPNALKCAEGYYEISNKHGEGYLSYKLKQTNVKQDLLNKLNIRDQQRFVISVKNPYINHLFLNNKKPVYPVEVKSRFGDHNFIPLLFLDLINFPFAQIILIGVDYNARLGYTKVHNT